MKKTYVTLATVAALAAVVATGHVAKADVQANVNEAKGIQAEVKSTAQVLNDNFVKAQAALGKADTATAKAKADLEKLTKSLDADKEAANDKIVAPKKAALEAAKKAVTDAQEAIKAEQAKVTDAETEKQNLNFDTGITSGDKAKALQEQDTIIVNAKTEITKLQKEITNTLNPGVTDAQEALDAATKDYDKAVEKLQGAIAKAQTAYDDWKSASDILAGEVRDARVKLLANGLSNADLNYLVKKAQDIVAKDAKVASVTVYRLYNAGLKQHLYTTDANEYEVLAERGWTQEGTAFKSATEGTPVYRLYNASLKVHLYTTDANEYTTLAKEGWTQEGIAFYSAKESEGTPVYRLYNAGLKKHLYTTDSNEYKVLAQRGWTQEGVALYSAK